MSDDWVKKYIGEHNRVREEKEREEQEARIRRRYAEAGAGEQFHRIRERFAQDVQTLNGVVAFQPVEFDGTLEGRFAVTSRGTPRVELNVSLNGVLVVCNYDFSPKGNQTKKDSKTLRISSDLDGRIAVHKNGDGEAFADESEVSEFLLTPLLNHISSQ